MESWRFKCYGPSTPNNWETWFDKQSSRVQAKHDAVFDILVQRPQAQWTKPHVKKLRGSGADLWEILITAGVAWRIFGWFSGEYEFTITGIGNHKGQVYDPREIITTSRRRRLEIESDQLEANYCARPKTP